MVFAGQEIRVNDAFGAWTSFTPTWVNFSLGNGSTAGEWRRVADFMIFFRAMVTLGSTSSFSGSLGLTLPGSLSGEGSSMRQFVPVWGFDSSASGGFTGAAVLQSGGGANLDRFYGPTTSVGWNSTTPITWATSDIIEAQGWIRTTS